MFGGITASALTIVLVAFASSTHAQVYPNRHIQLVVPFAAGGVADTLARLLAAKSEEQLGQPMIVLNRAGAGGIVGMDSVAKSKPDGYTLGVSTIGALGIGPAVNPNLPYDPVRDFTPIARLTSQSAVLIVQPDGRFGSLERFVEYARQNPRKVNYGTAGVGGLGHMVGELFSRAAGVEMVHVPYKGDAPAVTALMGKEVDLSIVIYTSAAAQIRAGQVAAIAVPSTDRLKELPGIPTLVEKGYTGAVAVGWIGVSGPAGLAATSVDRLTEYFQRTMALPENQARLEQLGLTPAYSSPAEYGRFVRAEVDKYVDIARKANIKAE